MYFVEKGQGRGAAGTRAAGATGGGSGSTSSAAKGGKTGRVPAGSSGKKPGSAARKRAPAGDATPRGGSKAGPAGAGAAVPDEAPATAPGVLELEVVDARGKAMAGCKYRVEAEGRVFEGVLDAAGCARVEGAGRGVCVVSLPGLGA